MFNRKQNRIADLEARLAVALRDREPDPIIESATAMENRRLRADLATTRANLRTTEDQLGESRQQVATLIARLGEYADRAIANGEHAERNRLAWKSARRRARTAGTLGEPIRDELWSLLDWSFWGAGMGDVFREPLADRMTAATTPEQRTTALRLMKAWTDSGRKPVGRWQYEDEKRRIARLRRACARYRTELAEQRAEVTAP